MSTEKIRVFIVEDHQLISEAWKHLLREEQDMEVIGTADNADDAVRFAVNLRPDVILMDINLKSGNGIQAATEICNTLPKTRIIGLSLHDDIAFVKKFLSVGAKGYLTKNTNKAELTGAIRKVMDNELYIANELKDRYFSSLLMSNDSDRKKELTMKEIDIVKLIATGLTSKEIGDKLFISQRTVETHRHNILKKLDLPNAAQLTNWAKEKGYI
ncbi:MAG: response regulator [Bacteroidota bacterium]|jgi:DNA-binding NarL/FixJ family response regulator